MAQDPFLSVCMPQLLESRQRGAERFLVEPDLWVFHVGFGGQGRDADSRKDRPALVGPWSEEAYLCSQRVKYRKGWEQGPVPRRALTPGRRLKVKACSLQSQVSYGLGAGCGQGGCLSWKQGCRGDAKSSTAPRPPSWPPLRLRLWERSQFMKLNKVHRGERRP